MKSLPFEDKRTAAVLFLHWLLLDFFESAGGVAMAFGPVDLCAEAEGNRPRPKSAVVQLLRTYLKDKTAGMQLTTGSCCLQLPCIARARFTNNLPSESFQASVKTNKTNPNMTQKRPLNLSERPVHRPMAVVRARALCRLHVRSTP